MTLMSNGNFSSINNYTVGQSSMGNKQTLGKKASANFGVGIQDHIGMNRDSNSPTPQRNGNKVMIGGGLKLPSQIKSITSGLNKLQRDSMGDTGSGEPQHNAPNFYEFPNSKAERDTCNSNIGL